MCAATNSKRGIVIPNLGSLALAATRPWFVPDAYLITAYAQAATPFLLASPNECSLMFLIGSLWAVNDLGTSASVDRSFS